MQKAYDLYVKAVESLDKYLTFADVNPEAKTAATSQIDSIKSKLPELQKKLPEANQVKEG